MRGAARRAVCVTVDPGDSPICSIVDRVLAPSGLTVEHATSLAGDADDIVLFLVDRETRLREGDALRRCRVPVIVLGDNLDDDGLIALMREAPVSHLLEDPADPTLGITTEKLATGDLFGLEKYVDANTRVGERAVVDDLSKRRAVDEVVAWAESVGARRPLLHRIASVVDELLMNALNGKFEPATRAVLRWGADDRTLALSVSDENGALSQRDVIDHVRRAKDERGRPEPANDHGGAGLGLYLVLANVASLVVNVEPGRRTEVVCLFDLARRSRPQIARNRSLHVFA